MSWRFESMNGFILPLCISRKLSEVCIFNLKSDIWQSKRGIPEAIVTYLIFIITRGLCYGISMMTSRHSGPPIGGEGNFQTTHGSIVVECDATSKHDRDVINTMTSQSVFYVDDATTFLLRRDWIGYWFSVNESGVMDCLFLLLGLPIWDWITIELLTDISVVTPLPPQFPLVGLGTMAGCWQPIIVTDTCVWQPMALRIWGMYVNARSHEVLCWELYPTLLCFWLRHGVLVVGVGTIGYGPDDSYCKVRDSSGWGKWTLMIVTDVWWF